MASDESARHGRPEVDGREPPLAGICTYDAAAYSGTTVDGNVALLRRLARMEHRTLLVLSAQLNAVPEWEVKCAFAFHLWQDAEHSGWLRARASSNASGSTGRDSFSS